MGTKDIIKIISDINKLNAKEKNVIFQRLKHLLFPNSYMGELSQEIKETKYTKCIICPHCKSEKTIKFGRYNDTQRYKCKECSKTFSAYTHTPIYRTHLPDKWIAYLECMVKGMSLRESQKVIDVHWTTLFYWRHKILSGLKQIEIDKFNGIVEVDETYILYSEKGKKNIIGRKPRKRGGVSKFRGISNEQVCILVAKDRDNHTISKVACMGRLSKEKFQGIMDSHIDDKTILCSDAWKSYKIYAKEKGIQHYILNASEKQFVIKDLYHIQHVNAFHSRFKDWIKRFKGVASKYLDDYLTWFNFIENVKYEAMASKKRTLLIKSCITDTLETYRSLRLAKFCI